MANATKKARNSSSSVCALNLHQVESAGGVIEPEDADEHEDRAGHGVEHEFNGGVDAALVAPDADEQGHRDEHDFPEEEEEEKVEREENADDADFEHQQHDKKFFDSVMDAVP